MNLQHENQIHNPALLFEFSKANDSQILPSQPFGSTSQFSCSFESFVEPFSSNSDDSLFCSEKYSEFPADNMLLYQRSQQEHDKIVIRDASTVWSHQTQIHSSQRNQSDKQSSRSCGATSPTRKTVSRAVSRGKMRIRWTDDLHKHFVMIVNSLGGPQKATPKAILEMMDSDVLTIFHVKSHLQNYRSTVHRQKALQEGTVERHSTDGVTELQLKIHKQIEESLQLQLEVQKSIDEQLQIQQSLQQQIDQQSKQLTL